MDPSSVSNLRHIVGQCPEMLEVIRLIQEAALEDVSVLVLGSTGTGKEAVARAIHDSSPRKDGPFVAFNCAGLSPDLLASELFGSEKGAFTGATQQRVGLIEKADWGTLFCDELGAAPLNLQAMLLRALEEGEVMRVGSTEVRHVDLRIVAATNADLDAAVAQGTFRANLLYRVRGDVIRLPDLAERGDDVLLLAEHFLAEHALRGRRAFLGAEARTALKQFAFPGNVRQLEQMIIRAVTHRPHQGPLLPKHLGFEDASAPKVQAGTAPGGGGTYIPPGARLEEAKRLVAQAALRDAGGNKSEAARVLGVD